MKRKAWACVLEDILSKEAGQKLSLKKARKRAVRAARSTAPASTKAQLKQGFDEYLSYVRAHEASTSLHVDGKQLCYSKAGAAQRIPGGAPVSRDKISAVSTTAPALERQHTGPAAAGSSGKHQLPGPTLMKPSAILRQAKQGGQSLPAATAQKQLPTSEQPHAASQAHGANSSQLPLPKSAALPASSPSRQLPVASPQAAMQLPPASSARDIFAAGKKPAETPAETQPDLPAKRKRKPARPRVASDSDEPQQKQPRRKAVEQSTVPAVKSRLSRQSGPESSAPDAPPAPEIAAASAKRSTREPAGLEHSTGDDTGPVGKRQRRTEPTAATQKATPANRAETRVTGKAAARASAAKDKPSVPVTEVRNEPPPAPKAATRAAAAKGKQAAAESASPPVQLDVDTATATKNAVGDKPPEAAKSPATKGRGGKTATASRKTPVKAAGKTKRQAATLTSPSKQMPDLGGVEDGAAEEPGAAGGGSWREDGRRTDVKHGRFSEQEKQTLRAAIEQYAQEKDLSTDDYSWLYHTRGGEQAKKSRGAWLAIAASLPHRKSKAVYSAATRMLHEGNYQGTWDQADEQKLLQLVAEKGRKWKEIGSILNRLPEGCRDKHKEIALGSAKRKGRWDNEETDKLRTAVEGYLANRVDAEGAPEAAVQLSLEDLSGSTSKATASGRAVVDDIDWGAISRQVGTRSQLQCLDKWYDQLSPSMVSVGVWGSGDDRRMLRSLMRQGPPPHEHQVDWDSLVPQRSKALVQRRFRLMCKCLPQYWNMDLRDVVSALVQTFAPSLLRKAATADANDA